MKKNLISFALAILALASCSKNELGKAGDTVKKIQTDFYSMTVDGDAGFEHFLEQGGASSTFTAAPKGLTISGSFGCNSSPGKVPRVSSN